MTEIRGSTPLPPASAARPAATGSELPLKLLQPLQGLLSLGQSAEAEVIGVRSSQADFEVVLRLNLPNGRETTVTAQSRVAIALGTAYNVSAALGERLQATPLPAAQQPLQLLDLDVLPLGSQVQARVIASQLAESGKFEVLAKLLGGPQNAARLLLDSDVPLPVGSLLTAQVRADRSLALLPLQGRLDRLALGQELGAQASRQGSLQALFGALQGAAQSHPALGQTLDKLLAQLPGIQQLADPQKLAQAIARSGAFLESSLLEGTDEAPTQDLKAGLLRLVAQLLPNLPGSSPLAAAQSALGQGQALPAFARQMLGNLGQSRQVGLDFPLPNRLLLNLGEEADLETLLKLAAAAISRLQTHQLSSLAQTQTTPEGLQLTTWQLEVPMKNGADIVPLQAWLQREEEPARQSGEQREPLWRVELAFDLAPLGPLQVHALLVAGSLSSQLWAEQADTAALIENELVHLRTRLEGAGLNVGELACRQGIPPQGRRTCLEQRFVDETA